MVYTAFKLKTLPYWVWFDTGKVERTGGRISATMGWTGDGNGTIGSISFKESMIEGEMTSDALGTGI